MISHIYVYCSECEHLSVAVDEPSILSVATDAGNMHDEIWMFLIDALMLLSFCLDGMVGNGNGNGNGHQSPHQQKIAPHDLLY